jgi:hypothetical protein
LRCRITSDWSADPTTLATPIGLANDGEVEDYMLTINNPCPTGMVTITSLPAASPLLNGLKLVINAASPVDDIAEIQCQKTTNIGPIPGTGITFTNNPPTGVFNPSPYPTWPWLAPYPTTTTMEARKQTAGIVSVLACTIKDSAGDVCATDPLDATVLKIKGQKPETTSAKLAKAERVVTVLNGQSETLASTPGIQSLQIRVDGKLFNQKTFQNMPSPSYGCLEIPESLIKGDTYEIALTATGKPGGSAVVHVGDVCVGQPAP